MGQELTSDIVIGLEIHIELATRSKLFCGCARAGSDIPNTRTCPVCLGHPGSKPVLNRKALDYALKLCIAVGCDISPELIFSRKSYFYPDMSKNYQITQYETPLGRGGCIKLGSGKDIRIARIHIEEDPAALVHPSGMDKSSYVLVDYNRSGDPLAEIVTCPDMTSPAEAREFMKKLIEIINYLQIFDIDSCIIKADANVSIKESGYKRVEVKNITGFKEIERALNYEVARQKQFVDEKKDIVLETRGWDPGAGVTRSMRAKESEDDYGYIIDPDLTITDVTDEMIRKVKSEMPELAQEKIEKFLKEYNIDKGDAKVLAHDRLLAELFEEVAKKADPVAAARWLRRELLRVLNYNKITTAELKVKPEHIIDILALIKEKKISEKVGQKIMEKIVISPFDVREYVKKNDLELLSDSGSIKEVCMETIKENPAAVAEYKEGKPKALNFLVGQVMRKTKGKASPKEVNETIRSLL